MGVGIAIEAWDGVTHLETLHLAPAFADVLASPTLYARLPKTDAGTFLRPSRGRASARKSRALASARAVEDAIRLLESIVADERGLDVLSCEEAATAVELARVRFDAGPRYVHAQSGAPRALVEPELRQLPGWAQTSDTTERVLPGVVNRVRLVDGAEIEVRDVLEVRLRWQTAIARHPSEWAALRAFVAARPDAGFRLVVV